MTKRLLFLLLVLVSMSARADYPADMSGAVKYQGNCCGTTYFDSVAAVCAASQALMTSAWLAEYGGMHAVGNSCYTNNGNYNSGYIAGSVGAVKCPYGGVYTTAGNMCIGGNPPPPACAAVGAGQMDVTTAYATGPSVGAAIAKTVIPDGGLSKAVFCPPSKCTVKPDPGPTDSCSQEQTPGPNGYYRIHCMVTMSQIGGSVCDPSVTPPPNGGSAGAEPSSPSSGDGKCPAGSVPAGQDSSGMTKCVGKATPSTAPTTKTEAPPTTTTDSGGNTTTTQQTSTSNADGSTTTTTTTTVTAPNGSKTTTQSSSTSAAPAGGTGVADKPEDKSDLCKQHPELTVCRNSQVQGSCALLTCDGDAIQCATLRNAADLNCRQKASDDALKASALNALGTAVAAGNDPQAATLPSKTNGATVALPSTLDTSGWLGGGAFFPDKSFIVQGKTIVIPFSKFADYFLVFRYSLMVVSLLVSFRMLSGAIIRE